MKARQDMPDFSLIRSPLQRAEAEHSYEVGAAIADGLYAAGNALTRAIDGIARTVARKPISDW